MNGRHYMLVLVEAMLIPGKLAEKERNTTRYIITIYVIRKYIHRFPAHCRMRY